MTFMKVCAAIRAFVFVEGNSQRAAARVFGPSNATISSHKCTIARLKMRVSPRLERHKAIHPRLYRRARSNCRIYRSGNSAGEPFLRRAPADFQP